VNCCVVPAGIAAVAGVTAMETNIGPETVREVEELIAPDVAEIVVVPWPALVARPELPTLLLMMATPEFDELHVATEVRFCSLPSVYVPVAVNCCVVPNAMLAACGIMAIDTSAAGFTTSVADALIDPELMPMDVVPVPADVARPAVPVESLIVATPMTLEVQYPVCVRFCVLPSV
jgi:hypothetical protein